MWHHPDSLHGWTNEVVMPTTGTVGVVFPEHAKARAYVNHVEVPIHNFPVNQGDKVKFKIKSHGSVPSTVKVTYNGAMHDLNVIPLEAPASMVAAKNQHVAAKEHPSDDSKSSHKHKMKHKHKGNKMDTSGLNLFTAPTSSGTGAAIGGGLGAGLLGGVLGGALLNNGGLFGNRNGVVADGGVATAADITSTVNQSAMMTALGDIKASVPYNEGQVQLALAQQSAALTNQIHQSESNITAQNTAQSLATAAGFANLNQNNALQTDTILSSINSTSASTLAAVNSANLDALRNTYALQTAITAEGVASRLATESAKDQVLAALNARAQLEDTRLITNLSNKITELEGDRRLTEATGNITIQNTNTANAVQAQSQQQQQLLLLSQLTNGINTLVQQNQHITSGIINLGGSMTGNMAQTNANTRVNS